MSAQLNNRQDRKDYVAVFISRETRKKLALAKIQHNFKSYDELILYLLSKLE